MQTEHGLHSIRTRQSTPCQQRRETFESKTRARLSTPCLARLRRPGRRANNASMAVRVLSELVNSFHGPRRPGRRVDDASAIDA